MLSAYNIRLTIGILIVSVLSWFIGSSVSAVFDKYFHFQPEIKLLITVSILLLAGRLLIKHHWLKW